MYVSVEISKNESYIVQTKLTLVDVLVKVLDRFNAAGNLNIDVCLISGKSRRKGCIWWGAGEIVQ